MNKNPKLCRNPKLSIYHLVTNFNLTNVYINTQVKFKKF